MTTTGLVSADAMKAWTTEQNAEGFANHVRFGSET